MHTYMLHVIDTIRTWLSQRAKDEGCSFSPEAWQLRNYKHEKVKVSIITSVLELLMIMSLS